MPSERDLLNKKAPNDHLLEKYKKVILVKDLITEDTVLNYYSFLC